MARIRSIHPPLFTDEAFVSLSMGARVLLIGIWTECDDQGIFEWKPVALKMRLFPVDNLDVEALLGELTGANSVRKFSLDGRSMGAVRNFCRWQRPKSPKFRDLIDDDIRAYVGTKYPKPEATLAEVVPFPQNGEIPPQMEGRREEGERTHPRKDSTEGTYGGPR